MYLCYSDMTSNMFSPRLSKVPYVLNEKVISPIYVVQLSTFNSFFKEVIVVVKGKIVIQDKWTWFTSSKSKCGQKQISWWNHQNHCKYQVPSNKWSWIFSNTCWTQTQNKVNIILVHVLTSDIYFYKVLLIIILKVILKPNVFFDLQVC